MSFRSVFIAVVIAFALILAAFLINRTRPKGETDQPGSDFVRASGKCAECHSRLQYSVVHEYEMSKHAVKGVSCLDCHQPGLGQDKKDHHGFVIANARLTAGNCRSCHEQIYQQFTRSRHAAPAWAAIYGEKGLTPEQVNFSETYQPGGTRRPPHPFVLSEGGPAMASGCEQCHSVGKPNPDGTIGTCTACHTRHTSSVAMARLPSTCGQCHMGPDHSQIEIYEESKHGVMFAAQEKLLNLNADPKNLTTRDMFVPTCATCHMSGINGLGITHDPSERLSYPVYEKAEKTVLATNEKVTAAKAIVDGLRKDGVLSGPPFSQPIDFVYFDFWHYDGRTAKHGAFMGGADFVQWHGNYPMLRKTAELKAMADDLRRTHGGKK
jgi:hydroxylamine dehydrogenase